MPAVREPYGELGGYYGGGADGYEAAGPDLREYLRILNKRKWIVISIVVAFVALGAVYTLMKTPLYTATVRLQIDRNVAKIVEGGAVTPVEGADFEFLKTQYELLQSRTMAERVAVALKLGDDADFLEPKGFSPLGAIRSLLSRRAGDQTPARPRAPERERAAAGIILDRRSVTAGQRLASRRRQLFRPRSAPRPKGNDRRWPMPSSPPTSTSASRPTPTPRPSSRTSSST